MSETPDDHITAAAKQAVMGNFQLSATLPEGKTFTVSGYLFNGESVESLNQRLDLLHDVADRQRTRAEIPELEKKLEMALTRLTDYRAFMDGLVVKQQGAGTKNKLTTQERQQLDAMDVNVKKLSEDIEEGRRVIAAAKIKVGLA